jgi:hypothetical protein
MFRHVVLFSWTPEATPEQIERAVAELRALPSRISELRSLQCGPDAGLYPGNFDFALVADFDDAEGYRVYRDHPAHREIVTRLTGPLTRERATVQYEI